MSQPATLPKCGGARTMCQLPASESLRMHVPLHQEPAVLEQARPQQALHRLLHVASSAEVALVWAGLLSGVELAPKQPAAASCILTTSKLSLSYAADGRRVT